MKNFQVTLGNGEIVNILAKDGTDAISYFEKKGSRVIRLLELVLK